MNYCKECGNEFHAEQKFCSECGKKIKKEESIIKDSQNSNEEVVIKEKNRKNNIFINVFLLLCLLAIVIYVVSEVKSSSEETEEENEDNEVIETDSYGNEILPMEEALYERAENLVYRHLTNPEGKENLSNTDIVGYDVYSFEEKDTGVYYFETDKGQFQLKVKYQDQDFSDPSDEVLFGSNNIVEWVVRDWNSNEKLIVSDGWED